MGGDHQVPAGPQRGGGAARIAVRSSATVDWKNEAVTRSALRGSGSQALRSVAVKVALPRPRVAAASRARPTAVVDVQAVGLPALLGQPQHVPALPAAEIERGAGAKSRTTDAMVSLTFPDQIGSRPE